MAARPTPTGLDEMAEILHRDTRGPGWELLTWLADAKYLTNDLIALRYYHTPQGVRSASYRMAALESWGLVTRRAVPRGRIVWHLTERGADLLSDYLRKTHREMGFDGAEGRVQEGFVRHRLDVTYFEVALRIHAAYHAGKVLSFVREPIVRTEAGDLRPDAAVIYEQDGRAWNLAVEIDRDTERPVRFAATKVPRYEALVKAEWRLHWDDLPTCLVVATVGGPERAERLKREVDALPVGEGAYRLFKFAGVSQIYQIPLSRAGVLPEVRTMFHEMTCMAARKPQTERRAVFA